MGKKRGKRGRETGEEGRGRGVETGGQQREREREERLFKKGTQRNESTFSLSLATTSERRDYKPSCFVTRACFILNSPVSTWRDFP